MFDTLRTVPVQASTMAINTLLATLVSTELHHASEALTSPGVIMNTAAIVCNGVMAVGKIGLRNRVEGIIDRHGYDERLVRTTSVSYCGRQATKMACERTGYLEEFFKTVNDPGYSKDCSWLPHL